MQANIYLGPLGIGVYVGAELTRTGLQDGNFWVAVAGVIICGSSLVLGYAVAHSHSKQADRPKDGKPK